MKKGEAHQCLYAMKHLSRRKKIRGAQEGIFGLTRARLIRKGGSRDPVEYFQNKNYYLFIKKTTSQKPILVETF